MERDRRVWVSVLILLLGVFNLIVQDSLAFRLLGLALLAYGGRSLVQAWRTRERAELPLGTDAEPG